MKYADYTGFDRNESVSRIFIIINNLFSSICKDSFCYESRRKSCFCHRRSCASCKYNVHTNCTHKKYKDLPQRQKRALLMLQLQTAKPDYIGYHQNGSVHKILRHTYVQRSNRLINPLDGIVGKINL